MSDAARPELRSLLQAVSQGTLPIDDAVAQLQQKRVASLEDATVDLDRRRRCGYAEVIFGEGKPARLICEIADELLRSGVEEVLATRISAEQWGQIEGLREYEQTRYNERGRTLRIASRPILAPLEVAAPCAAVAVVTAGSTDLPVAEEALETLAWMGIPVQRVVDVGVAGPQRLLRYAESLQQCAAIVVVAGMEGALPSAVGGYVPCPVIGVPTSCGYGAAAGGFAALLAMLSSCASNVTVVNIDAGFKGGFVAGLIAGRQQRETD